MPMGRVWNWALHAMIDASTAAGLRLSVISELHLAPEAREPSSEQLGATPSFLKFLVFVLDAG